MAALRLNGYDVPSLYFQESLDLRLLASDWIGSAPSTIGLGRLPFPLSKPYARSRVQLVHPGNGLFTSSDRVPWVVQFTHNMTPLAMIRACALQAIPSQGPSSRVLLP